MPTTEPADEQKRQEKKLAVLQSAAWVRTLIGVLGGLMPLVLVFAGAALFDLNAQSTISAYYHTDMVAVFVGTLAAIGMFLWVYRGYEGLDLHLSTVTGWAAFGVAIFPAAPDCADLPANCRPLRWFEPISDWIHLGSAFVCFSLLAYICLCEFTQSAGGRTEEKRRRDKIYRFCGWTIVVCLLAIAVNFVWPDLPRPFFGYPNVLVLESLVLFAFAVSWLVKGGARWFADAPEAEAAPK